MKVTEQEANTCGAICQHHRDKLSDAERVTLSQVAGAHACNESIPYALHQQAMEIVARVRNAARPKPA